MYKDTFGLFNQAKYPILCALLQNTWLNTSYRNKAHFNKLINVYKQIKLQEAYT